MNCLSSVRGESFNRVVFSDGFQMMPSTISVPAICYKSQSHCSNKLSIISKVDDTTKNQPVVCVLKTDNFYVTSSTFLITATLDKYC